MDASCAFIFGDAHNREALCVRSDDGEKVDYALLAGEWFPSEPIVFLHHMGRIPNDLIPSSDLWGALISDNFRNILLKNECSGWRTYPVEVYGANGKLLRGYHGLSITGRCGKIDETKSQIIEDDRLGTISPIKMMVGMYFPPESWDGSDIFLASDWGFKFCTERVAEALKSAKLTNVSLVRASEFRRPFVPCESGHAT